MYESLLYVRQFAVGVQRLSENLAGSAVVLMRTSISREKEIENRGTCGSRESS